MRKKGLVLGVCLLLLLLLPGLSKAEKEKAASKKINFAVKLSAGMNYLALGDPNKGVKGWYDNWSQGDDFVQGEAKPIHLCFDFEGDFIFNITPQIGIGIGAGYIQRARTSEVTIRFGECPERNAARKLKISAIPIRLGVFYTLSMNKMINIVFNAGAGLYLAKYSCNKEAILTGGRVINQTANGSGFGFHTGVGFEFNLSSNFAFVIEVQARYAKIGGFEGTIKYYYGCPPEYMEQGKLYYYEIKGLTDTYAHIIVSEEKPGGYGISNVRKARVDFSGFALRAGIKIKL